MPLSGGTSGAHDDSMHQGSAKRDVADGVAGLDSAGDGLIPSNSIMLTRSPGNNIYVRERTSSEAAYRCQRLGANNYGMWIYSLGIASEVQLANMKDVVNGIAALDAAGALLVPGSKMYYTRDGSDDVHIYERTSNEEAYAFHRVGADDYTFFVKESNVWKRMQTESMKDAANGIMGLGSSILPSVDIQLTRAMYELNSVLATSGNGTATKDGTTRRYSLDSGVGASSDAIIASTKTYTLGATALMMVARVTNITNGAGSVRASFVGLRNSFSLLDRDSSAVFYCDDSNVWKTSTKHLTSEESNTVTVTDGDILAIIATSSSVKFYVNNTLVATHTLNLTSNSLKVGASVVCTSGASTARSFDVDILDYGLEP